MKTIGLKFGAVVLSLFALVTLFMSTSVIFDLFGIRQKEGNYVLFVVVSNFICGWLYLLAAYGFFLRKYWATLVLLLALTILLGSFAGLVWHIQAGLLYEEKTVKALIFRIGLTAIFTVLSWKYIRQNKKVKL